MQKNSNKMQKPERFAAETLWADVRLPQIVLQNLERHLGDKPRPAERVQASDEHDKNGRHNTKNLLTEETDRRMCY